MPDFPVEDSPKFDFITEADFRSSLESDYRELVRCLDNGVWKGAHVIAGSIVEAVLTDYLIGTDYEKKTGKKPLEMELAPIIAACRAEKTITDRTADLSSVVRSYRNLIHPGRIIRLKEVINNKTALIAKGLVDVVLEEVASAKASSYGFTAEQIANKIEKDSSALAVLAHFLKETNDRERERLVADVLPKRFFFAREMGDETNSDDYQKCHRQAFDTLSDEAKTRIAKRFVKVLKEERGEYVLAYEDRFFRAPDLKYLSPADAAMVKAHLLSRLEKDHGEQFLEVLEGLGNFLDQDEVGRLISNYARIMAYGKSEMSKDRVRLLLYSLEFEMEGDARQAAENKLDAWIKLLQSRGLDDARTSLEDVKSTWSAGIPF